jgi:hypothetical protein
MWTRRALAGLALTAAAAGAVRAQAASGRGAEAAALRDFAIATHPRGREAAADPAWNSGWTALLGQADTIDLTDYLATLRHLLAWFGDGHTNVLPFEFIGGAPPAFAGSAFAMDLPLKARAFDDGLWIVETGGEASPLLGRKVATIGVTQTEALIRQFAADWPGNAAWAHNWAGLLLSSAGFAHRFRTFPGGAASPLPVRPDGGTPIFLKPYAGAHEIRKPLSRPPLRQETWAKAAGFANYLRAVPEKQALYVSIDEMDDLEGRSFIEFTKLIFAALEDPTLKRVVLDLRRNGGGNNFLGEGLRKHLERSRFNRPGGLVVLIGPSTFSAAQNLASRLERETYAVFVGRPTGGAPNHYGDARAFTGAATGLVAIVSSLPWFDSYPMDRRPWIMPDLLVAETFADWAAGRDPALEAALGQPFDGQDNDLGGARVFYYERDSQKADWKPFWR